MLQTARSEERPSDVASCSAFPHRDRKNHSRLRHADVAPANERQPGGRGGDCQRRCRNDQRNRFDHDSRWVFNYLISIQIMTHR